jgi:hypothetical protein
LSDRPWISAPTLKLLKPRWFMTLHGEYQGLDEELGGANPAVEAWHLHKPLVRLELFPDHESCFEVIYPAEAGA